MSEEIQGPYALRCELCGERIGISTGKPDPDLVVLRCYSCAAAEEAERITGDAA